MSSFESFFDKNIAQKIKYYRLSLGITQEKFSELLGKNDKYIGHIERGERKISKNMIVEIIEFLKIQPAEFFDFSEQYKY